MTFDGIFFAQMLLQTKFLLFFVKNSRKYTKNDIIISKKKEASPESHFF